MEADERVRQAEFELRLQIKKLEIEPDKAVRMRQLELQFQKQVSGLAPRSSSVDLSSTLDISKCVALMPSFEKDEVDPFLCL